MKALTTVAHSNCLGGLALRSVNASAHGMRRLASAREGVKGRLKNVIP